MYSMIKKHKHLLFGHRFTAIVDHRALEHLQTQPILRPRQVRWIMDLQEFDFDIIYQEGEKNTFADWLSRRPDFASTICEVCRKVCSITKNEIGFEEDVWKRSIIEDQTSDSFCLELDLWSKDRKAIHFAKAGYFKMFDKREGYWRFKEKAIVIPSKETKRFFLKRYHGREDLAL